MYKFTVLPSLIGF